MRVFSLITPTHLIENGLGGGINRYGYKKGLFMIKTSGNTVVIISDDRFQPKDW